MAGAQAQQALLLQLGLPADQLETLTARLDRLAVHLTERGAAARRQVGRRLRIQELARDLKVVVDQMDTINTLWVRHDPAILGEWRTSRVVRTRFRPPEAIPAEQELKTLRPGSSETRTAA